MAQGNQRKPSEILKQKAHRLLLKAQALEQKELALIELGQWIEEAWSKGWETGWEERVRQEAESLLKKQTGV